MQNLIGKSGTGIGKSGTGIGKSGTGIGRFLMAAGFTAMTGLTLFNAAVAGENKALLVSEQQGVLSISLHVDGHVITGQAPGFADSPRYQKLALLAVSTDPQISSHGSGTGSSTQSHGSGTGSSTDSHGSGTGASTESHGSGTGSSTESHGSGTGSSTESHGSGTGSSTESHGSGTGSSTESHGSGTGSSTDSHGSGTGSSTASHGSGTGSSTQSHGSGTGTASAGLETWGFAEIVSDHDGLSLVVYRYDDGMAREYLIATGATMGNWSILWTADQVSRKF